MTQQDQCSQTPHIQPQQAHHPKSQHPKSQTLAVRAGIDTDRQHGAVTPALYLSSNYSFSDFNQPDVSLGVAEVSLMTICKWRDSATGSMGDGILHIG